MAAEEGICVAIRMRPLNGRERIQGQNSLWRCLPAYNSITQMNSDGTPMPDRNPGFTFFTYDKVFGEESTTQAVYEAIGRPIVQSVLQGFNGTVFAYGQTSSGKTFTMVGGGEVEAEEGMLHLAARDIFHLISETSDRDFLLRVSYVEIYNENIRDLLDPDTPSLTIREDPRKGVYIEASESIITDFDSIMNALKTGSKNRRVEATAMNERSSRSHTIFRMVLESKERKAFTAAVEGAEAGADPDVDGAVLVATLNLVDLAGSESVRHTGATGNRAKEGGKINQSLLTLSRVIHALGQEGSGHIGFRDSKLTRILQPSLSGNAKMAIVCCITPAERYLEETRSTLQFASRAKMVKTRAVVNEVLDDRAQLKRLKKELQELKERQKQLESGAPVVSMEDVSRLEAERELMSGKVEQLEAERHEQANKIDRLTNLILTGGGLINPAASGEGVRTGGRHGRRGKRLRETWCPGEMKDLPPGAALRSLQALVEDDEADDRLVSNLNFGKISKRRGGSSVSHTSEAPARFSSVSAAGSDDVTNAMMDDAVANFKTEDLEEQTQTVMPVATPSPSAEDAVSAAQLAEIRAILSMHSEEEEEMDVVSMVKAMADSLLKQREKEAMVADDESAVEPASEAAEEGVGKEQAEVLGMAMEDKDSKIQGLQAAHEEALKRAEDEAEALCAKLKQLEDRDAEMTVPHEVLHTLASAAGMTGIEDDVLVPKDVMCAAVHEISTLKAKTEQATRQQAALELHADGSEALRLTLAAQVEALQAQLMAASEAADMTELQEKVRELEEGNAQMAAALEEAEERRMREVASLEEQLASMEADNKTADERDGLVAEVERLTGELEGAMEKQTSMEEQLKTQQDAMCQLNSAQEQLAAERDGLLAQVESLTAEMEKVKDEAASVEAELREQLRMQQEAVSDVMAERNDMSGQQSDLAAEVERLGTELAQLKDEAAAKETEFMEQFKAQEEILAQASTTNEQMAEEQRMLMSEVEVLRTELEGAKQATAVAETEEGEAEQLRQRVDELTRQLEEREQAMATLEDRQKAEATTLEFLTAEATTYREESERLGVQLATTTGGVKQLCETLSVEVAAEAAGDAEELDLETILQRASEAAQRLDQVARDRASELMALQSQLTAMQEQLQQEASQPEDSMASSTALPRVSFVSLARQSVGSRTSMAAAPPQPLLDELRLKLSKNRDAEQEAEEEEGEMPGQEEEAMAMDDVTVGMEGVAMEDQTIELPVDNEQQPVVDEEEEAAKPASRASSLCPSVAEEVVKDDEEHDGEEEEEKEVAEAPVDAEAQSTCDVAVNEAEVEALKARVVELEEMIERLTMDSTGVHEEVERLQAALATAQEEVTTSQQLAMAKDEQMTTLAEQLQQATDGLSALEGSLPAEEAAALASDVEQLREQMAATMAEKQAAEAEVSSLAEHLGAATREVQSLQERLVSEAAVAERLVQDLEEEIATLQQSVSVLTREKEAAAAASEAVDALGVEMAALQDRLMEKEAEVASGQQRVEELEAQLASAPSAVDAPPMEAQDGENKAQRLQGLLLNEQNAKQEAENALAVLQVELTDARAAVRRMEEQQEEATTTLETAQSHAKKEMERLVSELAVAEADGNQLREQVGALIAELCSTREQLTASRSEVVDTETDDAGLRKRVSQLQTQLDLAESRASKHEARVKELETELHSVERSAEDGQQHARKQMEQLEREASRHETREGEVASLKEACNAMSNRIEALKAERDEAVERAGRAADAAEALEKELHEIRGSPDEPTGATEELAALRADLEQARSEAAERAAEASQMQVRLRRAQQEVEVLSNECATAREEGEQMREKVGMAAEAMRQVEELTREVEQLRAQVDSGVRAMAELEPMREKMEAAMKEAAELREEKERVEDETKCLQRGMEVIEGHLEAERLEVQGLQGQVARLNGLLEREREVVTEVQSRVEAAEQEARAKAEEVKEAEAAKAVLIEEMNTLSFAECDARTLAEQREIEVMELKQALEQARSSSSSSREETAAVVEELRAQLARRDRDYDAVHGDNYRMKRELSELREAAESAEVAIMAHTQQMDKVQEELRARSDEVSRLDSVIQSMKRDLEAKDKRIQHLDRSKLTVEQVERIQKLKKDHEQAQEENAKLKKELVSAQQALHDVSKSGADDTVAETLEVQSNTINELMAVRENLTAKLRRAQDTCRKLEVERTSVFESLRELPSESLCFDQVPEDLSVAVNMLIEKYITEVAESRKESVKSQNDRNVLLTEVQTLTEEKDALKRKVQELQKSLDAAEAAEQRFKGKSETGASQAAGAEAKVRQLQAAHDAAQQEANNSIRFLEKENLELMMEIKELKTRILKLQTEVDTLRSTGALPGPTSHMTPSGRLTVADTNVGDRHHANTSMSNVTKRHSSSSTKAAPTVPKSYAAAMHDKENAIGAAANMLRGVSGDDTAPPFRSIDDDEDGSASAQCKQS